MKKTAKKLQGIARECWDFSECGNDEAEACCLYEYGLESPLILSEVAKTRKGMQRERAVSKKLTAWLARNPRPERPTEYNKWEERLAAENRDLMVKIKLPARFHFLLHRPEFPNLHWLQIPRAKRLETFGMPVPGQLRWGSDRRSRSERKMFIRSIEDFLAPGIFNLDPFAKFPGWSGNYVFSVDWNRSNTALKQDFGNWLNDTRPKDQVDFHSSPESDSRRTTHRELLKALGVWRLLRDFNGDVDAAADFTQNETGKSLYAEESEWRKAKKKAEIELATFQKVFG